MDSCCSKTAELLARKQIVLVRVVLGLNLAMFLVEAGSGIAAHSTALLGDSLDMLGDAIGYGVTLYVLRGNAAGKRRAALLKAALMAAMAAGVLSLAGERAISGRLPLAGAIGAVGALAFAVNALCFALLTRRRADDINMSSAWACARNDLIANVLVIGAGVTVGLTHSWVPDFVVGVGIAALYLGSALATALAAMRTQHASTAGGIA